ncbi:MAG: vitamin B12-dependent ribonucleotide reductase [Planctomycetes bacterium]|nr:vitamin B12-dependent ribonucleotide reductase [Planctomycetota bacterium]
MSGRLEEGPGADPRGRAPAERVGLASGEGDGARRGLRVPRRFTSPEVDPFETVRWERRRARILGANGSIVFEQDDVEVPAGWSLVAGDVVASKYFRSTGTDESGQSVPERSVRQVVRRMVGCWGHWGREWRYFAGEEDAEAFEAELAYMLLHQIVAPNSPQWFNTGLAHVYGITGPAQGHFYADPETGEVRPSEDAYTHPQPHACFIQSVRDDLVNEGGIMDLWVREARLFKYGSGSGTNFSDLRGEGEPLSGGGISSGLMSFLRVGDRAAGAIRSGGTTRRAAKMVCLDMDHPDIEAFIRWKVDEERKVRALIEAGYGAGIDGEAYATVSGQNANNSVRATNAFLEAVEADGMWDLRWRTDGRVSRRLRARELWDSVAKAAWTCADPGVQYATTINEWHTCPRSGPIRASNPCSEYLFLDDTACNLASLNLTRFYDPRSRFFDIDRFRHACRLWTIVLELSIVMAQYPSREIARRSHDFRTLGLGFANLGTLLMLAGVPYDSDRGRTIAACVSAVMTAEAYATSAEMARSFGPFPAFEKNREPMLRVIRNHRRAAYNQPPESYEDLSIPPCGIDPRLAPPELLRAAREGWDRALDLGERHGYRNAQVSVIAPTGTIGLVMDCDTTGIEPDYALVKFKKLAGGGHFKIANGSIAPALRTLGYTDVQGREILAHIAGSLTLHGAPHVNPDVLAEKGLRDEEIERVEAQLSGHVNLRGAFSPAVLGEICLARLGFPAGARPPGFDLLRALGFSDAEVDEASRHVCGHLTIEDAPHLAEEHLPIFDCASRNGPGGRRCIRPEAHILMMAAVQPFVSGGISKTVNLPAEATVDEVRSVLGSAWKLGLKAVAVYRDGSKCAQPLSAGGRTGSTRAAAEDRPAAAAPAAAIEPSSDPRRTAPRPAVPAEPAASPEALRPRRRPLPTKRRGFTQEARVGGHKIYLRTGEYEDGALGEIFIDMHKEGAAFRSIMNGFAIAISKGLQYGVPLEEFVETFTFTRFSPHGVVEGHPNIRFATSIVDYVFRVLALEYLGWTHIVQVAPSSSADRKKDPDSAGGTGAPHETEGPVSNSETDRLPIEVQASSGGAGGPFPGIEAGAPSALQDHMAQVMGDAPFCDVCGHMTIRSGACYRCLNCGNSLGCS